MLDIASSCRTSPTLVWEDWKGEGLFQQPPLGSWFWGSDFITPLALAQHNKPCQTVLSYRGAQVQVLSTIWYQVDFEVDHLSPGGRREKGEGVQGRRLA